MTEIRKEKYIEKTCLPKSKQAVKPAGNMSGSTQTQNLWCQN